MTAISLISMTPEVMAFGLSLRAANALSLRRDRRRMHRHVPDLLGIFANGAVGGKPGHARHVEDAGPRPGRDHLPACVDAALRLVIGVEIGADHVMVEITQRMRDGFEPARLARRELARADRIDGACELW